MNVLEDIYLPFKPKRRTRATKAKEKGLEPLAEVIFKQDGVDPAKEAKRYIDKEKKYSGQFLKVNSEEFTFEPVDEIKESSHSEMFHTDYLLMIHIKSLKPL